MAHGALGLGKRLTPDEIAAMQAAEQSKAAANRVGHGNPVDSTTTQRVAAQAATSGTTIANQQTTTHTSASYSFYDKFGKPISSSSSTPSTTSILSTSAIPSTTSSPSASPTTTSSRSVLTVTEKASSSASSAVATGVNSANDSSSTSTNKMSTGTIVGIVAGVLLGLLLLGAIIGWIYRKWAGRQYSVNNRNWNKMQDDDISPFPPNEKLMNQAQDDIYGPSSAPVIGSRRALALARQNAFNSDGSYRPETQYVMEQGNRAGYGAGHSADQGPYIAHPMGYMDQRSYNAQGPHAPMPHMYSDQFESDSPHALSPPGSGTTRQLLGPAPVAKPFNAHGMPISPVAMGRPPAPQSEADFASLYQYGDMPASRGPFGDEKEVPYSPQTTATHQWHDEAAYAAPTRPTRPGDEHRRHTPPSQDPTTPPQAPLIRSRSPSPPTPVVKDFMASHPLELPHTALPDLRPMSPIRMSTFELRRDSRPLTMYEDESSQQKRMYTEVATAAGVVEPPTPKLNSSTSSRNSDAANTTHSSFSAGEMTPRLPTLHLDAPAPYVHGQPLSPLTEVETPRSGMSKFTARTTDTAVSPSKPSAAVLPKLEENPFERTLVAARQNIQPAAPSASPSMTSLAPPFGEGPAFPSPAFPPPSPGGMSVPGSISDSPARWSGMGTRAERAESRGVSMFYGEDAYGGI